MTESELPRVLRLLWGRAEPGRRGPKPGRTIHDLGAAAVRIADADGLGAVSMSRVAAELGLTTMALYRYVDAKDDLYAAMLDAAYGPPPACRYPRAGWRKQLEAWCLAGREVLFRHPWIVQIRITEPPLAPNVVQWTESGLRALAGTKMSEQEKLSSILLADVYVRGLVQLAAGMTGAATDASAKREADVLYARRLADLIDEDSFPAMSAALLSGSLTDEGDFAEEEFMFGLQTVLDGIAARVERAARR